MCFELLAVKRIESPFEKGDERGIWLRVDRKIPPNLPFSKGGKIRTAETIQQAGIGEPPIRP
jgi:hypothetical protein